MSSRPWRGGASTASSPTRSTWCLPHNRNTSSDFAGYFLSSLPCKRESIFVCERHLDPRVRGDDKRGGTVFETPSFPPPIQAFRGRLQRESIFVCERHLDPRVRGDDKRGGTDFETPSFLPPIQAFRGRLQRKSIFVRDSGSV